MIRCSSRLLRGGVCQTSPPWTESQTLVKPLPYRNYVADSNNTFDRLFLIMLCHISYDTLDMYSFEICSAKMESSVDLAYLYAVYRQINIWQTPGCCLCNSVANGDKSYPRHVKTTTSSGSTVTFNSPDKDITRKQKGVLPLGTFRMNALPTTCTVDLCTRPPPTLLWRSKIVLLCPGGPNITL